MRKCKGQAFRLHNADGRQTGEKQTVLLLDFRGQTMDTARGQKCPLKVALTHQLN